MATKTKARVSVHDLDPAELPAYTAWHLEEYGIPPLAGAEDPPDPDPEPDPKPDPDPDPDPKPDPEPTDWKAYARKHERDLKKERKERERLERELKDREDADKTEHERALEEAKKTARDEALSEVNKERRSDRLESAVTRLSARGVQVGEGDDATTVKFRDPEDVQQYIERAIAKGDLDADDIFDGEHKVKTDELTAALADLAKSKPHWVDQDGSADGRPRGGADAGKGGGGGKGLEDMSVEEHIARKQKK